MDCKSCKESREIISRHAHEADLDRMDRVNKRWFAAWLITFVLLVGCVAGFVWYESQWEDVSTEVSQEVDTSSGSAYVIGVGDYHGED